MRISNKTLEDLVLAATACLVVYVLAAVAGTYLL